MDEDMNVAQAAEGPANYDWLRRCIGESMEHEPVVMSLLTVALAVSAGLIGLRIWTRFRAVRADDGWRAWLEWAGLLEFALGRLVLAGIVIKTCLLFLELACASTQGAARRLPLDGLTSLDVYLICTPLLGACVAYANCTVSRLIGKMGRGGERNAVDLKRGL